MSTAVGLLAAAGAAVAFGVQYVPVKRHAIYDGATFQWFMCSGILFCGSLAALVSGEIENGCPLPVVFGGILWSLSNYAVLPLVKLLGIGLGFSLYHFVNLVVGYCTGRFGIFGVPRLTAKVGGDQGLLLCDLGCGLVLVSFVAMLFVESQSGEPPTAAVDLEQDGCGCLRVPLSPGRDALGLEASAGVGPAADPAAGQLGPQGPQGPPGFQGLQPQLEMGSSPGAGSSGSPESPVARLKEDVGRLARQDTEGEVAAQRAVRGRLGGRLVGVLLALVAGGLAGVQSVPATLYNLRHPAGSPMAVVLPQCFGIWLGSSVIYMTYSSFARLVGSPVPHSVIRPAYYSGCVWAVGFALMIIGIRELGYSVGYTLDAVGPIAVSSLLSIFVYREISGTRHLAIYSVAFMLQLAGSVLIATFGAQGS